MAINKKLIHFETFENFNSKKLSANKENTKYTLGVNGSALTGDPEILYQSIVYIKDTLQQWTHGKLYNGNEVLTKVTHQQLLDLRSRGKLIPGCFYCITDYVTTTSLAETRSLQHIFNLIVQALTPHTLSEDAVATNWEAYFDGNDVGSWEIKYCIDNDASRFAWADTTNGKGVIYYMKDEFNNEAWYDFKNIQFLRTAQWFTDNPQFTTALFSSNTYFFTFSRVVSGVIYDDSLYTSNYHATDNHLGRSTAKITKLNNTIFVDIADNGAYGNTLADGHGNNTFGQGISNNTIGPNFQNNIITRNFQNNIIGSRCQNNIISSMFVYNNIGGYCYDNRFVGNVSYCNFGAKYQRNNFNAETLSYCNFGSNISWISDIPTMSNVTFDHSVLNGTNSIYLSNTILTSGDTALSKLTNNTNNILFTKSNNKYSIVNLSNVGDITESIYDLGSFDSNKGGEDAAYNINIIRNPKLLFLRYYNTTTNKYVLILLVHTNINGSVGEWLYTKQFIYLDGRIDVRKCWFLNVLGTYQTLNDSNHTTSWLHFLDLDNYVYSNGEKIIVNKPELKTLANNAFNNQANTNGYYGTLANYGFTENAIDLQTITVYDRGNNKETLMFMNVLIKYNNQWIRVYTSDPLYLENTQDQKPITFKLVKTIPNFKLSKNDLIAITFIDDNAMNDRFGKGMGLKTISISGGMNGSLIEVVEISTNPTIASNWAPAMSFEYYSDDDLSVVHSDRDETINGIKTFNHNINTREIVITDTDNHKTVIRNNIDPGEFKVTKPDSNNGFIIRTNSSSTNNNIQQLEVLSTNGSSSHTYKFPFKNGTVALTDDLTGKLDKTEASSTYTKKLTHDILSSKVDSLSTVVEGLTTSNSGIVDLGVNPDINTVTQPGIYKGITRQTEARWYQSYTSFILIVTNDLSTTDWVNNYIETNNPVGIPSGWVKVGVIQTMFYTYNYPMNDSAAYSYPGSYIKTRTGYSYGSSYEWRSWKYIETIKELSTYNVDKISGYYSPDLIYLYGVVNSIELKYSPSVHFLLGYLLDGTFPYKEYTIWFTAGNDCSITLHEDFLIANGEIPVLQTGASYEMSVVVVEYSIDGVKKKECKIAIVPFKAPLS